MPPESLRAIRVGGVLGCTSAAESYGLAVPERSTGVLHVSLPDNASRVRSSRDRTWHLAAGDEPGVELHWLPHLEPVRGWRVAPQDALLQMAGCTTTEWLTAAVDSGRRTRSSGLAVLAPADLASLRDARPSRARAAVDLSDGSSESPPESIVRLRLLAAGIPFATQVRLLPGCRVNFLLEGRVVLEVDGARHHSGEEAFEAGRARDALLRAWGHRVIGLSYRQVMEEWPAMLSMIRRVLAEAR
jgi:very-short-patch-repair endonuclease